MAGRYVGHNQCCLVGRCELSQEAVLPAGLVGCRRYFLREKQKLLLIQIVQKQGYVA